MSKLDISGAAGAASPSALHACLSSERPSSAVLLATGSPASPDFTEALFEDDAGVLLSTAAVGGTSTTGGEGGEEPDEGEKVGVKGALAHVVGPGEMGIAGAEKDSALSGAAGEGGGDEDGRALKRLKAEEEGGEASMTIAERLEALSEAIDEEAVRAGSGKEGGGVLVAAAAAAGGGGAVQPRAESLATVLTQALQSGDESLLEQCLAVGDPGVIAATVERLPSSKVLQFLLR